MEVLHRDAEIGVESIRQRTPTVQGNRDMRLSQIQEQVGRGEYQVDTQAVANAILRRLLEDYKGTAFEARRGQAECS
jgi:anti-sigma28 factor (negative regulator of flagellin synthesis)